MLTIAALLGIFVALVLISVILQFILETALHLSPDEARHTRDVVTWLTCAMLVEKLLH